MFFFSQTFIAVLAVFFRRQLLLRLLVFLEQGSIRSVSLVGKNEQFNLSTKKTPKNTEDSICTLCKNN